MTPLRPAARVAAIAVLVVLAALAVPVPAAAKQAHVLESVLDRTETVSAQEFTFAPCGDTAVFVPIDGGFRFEERQTGTSDLGLLPGGYLALGCGQADLARTAPVGARSVEVRFRGDRGVDEFDVEGTSVTRPGREFTQEVLFTTPGGQADRRVAYMDAGGDAQPLQPVAVDGFAFPAAEQSFAVSWNFQDASYFVGPTFPDVLSGQAFNATVLDVQLRYPGLPAGAKVSESLERSGKLLVGRTGVAFQVADGDVGSSDLRVRVAEGLAFDHLRAPDGSRLDDRATRLAPGPDGFDRSAILVETLADGSVEVTVPRELVAAHGAGKYTVAFGTVDSVRTYAWLLPFVALVLFAPVPFALVAYRHVRRFEDEAFGGFRRSARNLRVALVVAVAYYAVVLLSHFLGSRVELMTAWPLPLEAILLYLQVAIAIGAFLALYAVARELYRITVPKPLPAAPAAPALTHEDAT